MGAKYGAATSLRSCCVVLGDQDGWGTNRLSKAESILGTGMSQNLSRGRRPACIVSFSCKFTVVTQFDSDLVFKSFRFYPLQGMPVSMANKIDPLSANKIDPPGA